MLHGYSLVLQLWLGDIEKHIVENIETVSRYLQRSMHQWFVGVHQNMIQTTA